MLWTQKYAPRSLKEVAGNEDAKEEIRKWALEADRGKKVQPILVYGAVGIGKSAMANALALEMGWDIIETNASDLRDADTLKKMYGLAASSGGLYGNRRLILIDEIDSVSDRQEFAAVQQIIRENSQPVMLIANDAWDQKLSALRFQCKQVEMRKVNSASIRKRLKEVIDWEIKGLESMGVKRDGENGSVPGGEDAKAGSASLDLDAKVEEIAKNSAGDIRGALNDLQGTMQVQNFDTGRFGRDRDSNIFDAVRTVFKTMKYESAVEAGRDYNTQEFDMFMKWLEENIPLEYEKEGEVADALNWLSRADIFKGRIMQRQHWGYLKYVNALSTAGVALSKLETYRKFSKYQFPSVIKTLGQTRKNREMMKGIKRKVAMKLHVSIDEAIGLYSLLSANPELDDYLELTEDERSTAAVLYENEKKEKRKRGKQD